MQNVDWCNFFGDPPKNINFTKTFAVKTSILYQVIDYDQTFQNV